MIALPDAKDIFKIRKDRIMKKFLSAIIIMALSLTLIFSLASCATDDSTSVGDATLTSYKKGEPMRRSDEEIEKFISTEFGTDASNVTLRDDAPEFLEGLYCSYDNVYFAYLKVLNEGGNIEAEFVVRIFPDDIFNYEAYVAITTFYNTERVQKALQQTSNYILSNTLDESRINQLVWDKFAEINGYCNSYRGYHTYEKGVSDLYYSDEFNTYIAYIDTFGMRSYNTGIKALVVIRDDIVLEIDVLAYCFAEDIDDFPGEYDVEVFFEQFIGIDPRNDHMYPLDGYVTVSNDFIDALNESYYLRLAMSDRWIDQFRFHFRGEMHPVFILLIAVIVIVCLIVGASYLLLPGLLLTAFILFIIILIIAISKRKFKKRLRAFKKEAESLSLIAAKANKEGK